MASNVGEFFRDKNILLTGSTGFLGKILMEKILRSQPGVGRIFVLIRAEDAQSAKIRLKNEVTSKELFSTLRERHGHHFEDFINDKVVPVLGDVCLDNLGIEDSVLHRLWENLDVVVNNAANTVFDERYDVALNVNTKGPRNVIQFAKGCRRLQVLLHVSTAYVFGRRGGTIEEKPLRMGENVLEKGSSAETRLDIEAEFDLVERIAGESETEGFSPPEQAKRLKRLGLERARAFGWPNTYTFTKAMGEMILEHLREDLPVVIVRPSIIESTFAEPFPGWIEGKRTIDILIVEYSKGGLSSFLADPNLILDVIPADMVVNAMMAAAAAHANSERGMFIYHVASSVGNPLSHPIIVDSSYKYFSLHPRLDKDGTALQVKQPRLLESMNSFRQYMMLRYKIPLEVFSLVNDILCKIFAARYDRLVRKYNFVMYVAELYEPYAFFEGRFDNLNIERLRKGLSTEDLIAFNFDVKCIDWFQYFSGIHIPGIVKYVIK